MNAKEAAGKCKEYADYEYRQDMLCPHFGTETFEQLIQQTIGDATLPFREFANDFLDWDGEVEPHRTRMQLADMARRLLDLPCAKSEQSCAKSEQEK